MTHDIRSAIFGQGRPLTAALDALVAVASLWTARRRGRRDLGRLSAHQLKDIGLDPLTATQEATRWFWQD